MRAPHDVELHANVNRTKVGSDGREYAFYTARGRDDNLVHQCVMPAGDLRPGMVVEFNYIQARLVLSVTRRPIRNSVRIKFQHVLGGYAAGGFGARNGASRVVSETHQLGEPMKVIHL